MVHELDGILHSHSNDECEYYSDTWETIYCEKSNTQNDGMITSTVYINCYM